MKTSIKILAIFLLLLCVACAAKRSTQSKMEKTQQELATEGTDIGYLGNPPDDSSMNDSDSEDSNTTAQIKEGATNAKDANIEESASISSTSNENSDVDDNSQMYNQLEMTDVQIQNFENSVTDFKTRQRNMANGEMLGTVANEKERILKEILSPEQYASYQTWKNEN